MKTFDVIYRFYQKGKGSEYRIEHGTVQAETRLAADQAAREMGWLLFGNEFITRCVNWEISEAR